ncbi:hypothetical protein FJZ40_00450, partial [Candidatus Shapirobacteria bacterium]|nr:hypothetical protein [Candidatus Shapirobacteria bacterium]
MRNESADPLLLAAQARDFIVVDVKGTPKMVEEQTAGRWSLASWIVVSPTDFVLQPKTSRNVDVVIMVPENALPGGHYASVYFAPQVGPLAGGAAGTVASGSSIEPRLGGLISLRVAGPVTEEAFLRRLEIPRFSEYGPIKITTEIENIGEVHVQPKGKIEIKDFLGNVLQSFNLEERN